MSDLLVMALPMPQRPSSVSTSTSVLRSSSGLLPCGQPPSTVPPVRPVIRRSVIFMLADSIAVLSTQYSVLGTRCSPLPTYYKLHLPAHDHRVRPAPDLPAGERTVAALRLKLRRVDGPF